MNQDNRILIAISAASGMILGIKTLEYLLKKEYNVELIISENAYYIAKQELGLELAHNREIIKNNILNFLNLQDKKTFLKVWLNDELWADPASGSCQFKKMIITPASMATVASIASGIAEKLITRAADVIIKEGQELVIVPRETPFSVIHLENMLKLSKMGVKIVPPIVGFYNKVNSIDDCINFIVGKTLDASNIRNDLYKRWTA